MSIKLNQVSILEKNLWELNHKIHTLLKCDIQKLLFGFK